MKSIPAWVWILIVVTQAMFAAVVYFMRITPEERDAYEREHGGREGKS